MVIHQFLADGLVGLGRAKQHTGRHYTGAPATFFQHTKKQRQEQQFHHHLPNMLRRAELAVLDGVGIKNMASLIYRVNAVFYRWSVPLPP